MAKPIATPTAFATVAPPWSLTSLDSNFTSYLTAFNDYSTYNNYLADTSGVANSITVNTPAGTAFAYTAGIHLQVKVNVTSTATAVTLNVNSLGGKTVKNPDGSNPAVGQFVAGGIYEFQYDGTNFQVIGGGIVFGGLANPTGTIGLTTVNGSATTAMRSDGAPALSQAIVPTWTGAHTFNAMITSTVARTDGTAGTYPFRAASASSTGYQIDVTNAALDSKLWDFTANATDLLGRLVNDSGSTNKNWLDVTRSAAVVTTIALGNATDNPAFSFLGTGTATFAGMITSTMTRSEGTAGVYPFRAATSGSTGFQWDVTNGVADSKLWDITANGTDLLGRLVNDAGNTIKNWLDVTRSAAVVSAMAFGNATDNPTFSFLGTGVATFNGNISSVSPSSGTNISGTTQVQIRGGNAATIAWVNSAATANNRVWDCFAGSGAALMFRVVSDDYVTTTTNWLTVNRSGPTPTSIQGYGPTAAGAVDMTPDTGSFTITYTGLTATVTGTAFWSRTGNLVVLVLPAGSGTSNTTTFTATGLPAVIQPARTQDLPMAPDALLNNSSASGNPTVRMNASSGTIDFAFNNNTPPGSFTAAGTKGIQVANTVHYMLN